MLSNPGVGFKIMKDDKLLYDLKPEAFGERICRIFQNVRSEELAEFDEIEDLRALETSMTTAVTNPTELSRNIDLALRFFQNDPGRLGKEALENISRVTAGGCRPSMNG